MKRVYFPPELWTVIYQYDNTYKIHYNECMQEMNSYFIHNIMVSMMKACIEYYDIYSVNSISLKKKSYLNYIIYKKNNHGHVYSEPNSILHNKNIWNNYIKKNKKKVYIYNIKKRLNIL